MSFPKANIRVKRRKAVRAWKYIPQRHISKPRKPTRRKAPKDLPSLISELKWAAEIFARCMEKDGNQDGADFCRELIKNTDICLDSPEVK